MNEYYTLRSLLEFGTAVVAITAVVAAVGYLLGDAAKPYLKWAALVCAMGLAYLGAAVAAETEWTKWVVAFFNGLMLFLAAVGINQLANGSRAAPVAGPVGMAPVREPRKFWGSWL
jgi:hypothetical protein